MKHIPALACLLLTACAAPASIPPTVPTTDPHIGTMRRYHAWADASQPAGAVIFLGDSITEGLAVSAVAPVAVNYGIGKQATGDLLVSMRGYGSIGRARLVVLTIGTNDVSRKQLAGIEDRLRAISAAIPVPLLWNAVPPSTRGDSAPVNAIIRKVCAERPDCTYLETPFQPGDFRDGTHLSDAGYARWIAAMRYAIP